MTVRDHSSKGIGPNGPIVSIRPETALPLKRSSDDLWSPLSAKDEIRILELHPGAYNDPIRCTIKVVSLSSNPQYEAVSYVWGQSPARDNIRISDIDVPITTNLYNALKRFRLQDAERMLWIDQLCIDQHDINEKAEQVQLMREIYKSCTQCLIWLGELDEKAEIAVSDIENIFTFFKQAAEPHKYPDTDTPILYQDNAEGETARKAMHAMMTFGNPYWTRIWTVQECILPPKATLLWSTLSVPYEVLVMAAYNICVPGRLPRWLYPRSAEGVRVINMFTHVVRGLDITKSGEGHLLTLHRWRYRNALDPRDKIYALAGLFPKRLPSWQACSYSIDPAKLYANATIDLVKELQDLEPLIAGIREEHVTPELPTWAYDMEYRRYHPPYGGFEHLQRYQWFQAGGNRPLDLQVLRDDTVLSLSGVFVDKIAAIHDGLGEETWSTLSNSHLIDTVKSWKALLQSFRKRLGFGDDYIVGGWALDAFRRTILGDLIGYEIPERRATEGDLADLDTFLDGGRENQTSKPVSFSVTGHSFFITDRGYIGFGPPTLEVGDDIWVLFGGRMPFVVSRRGAGYEFRGEAYVHGIMDGEAVERSTVAEFQRVKLV